MKKISKMVLMIITIIIIGFVLFTGTPDRQDGKEIIMIDLEGYNIEQIKDYAGQNELILDIKEEYSEEVGIGKLIIQTPTTGTRMMKNDRLYVVVSKGETPGEYYLESSINELGAVPIMMYHGVVNLRNDDTFYTGGNVDKAGYNRTVEAFISDLEMYYGRGYRMMRLRDYISGYIDTEFGKSPIILTFDDGNKNNINILGKDENGDLVIDPDSAVGILENFKKKYDDFNVTATFFLNEGLFQQPKYNEDILKWLVKNGYDIGNHTRGHVNFTTISKEATQSSIALIYQKFDEIIPNNYVNIIALPFGSPYNKNHDNFPFILEGEHNGYRYITEATLRVGWEPELSPYHNNFDRSFLKRIRAWDNEGKDFDIQMCFNMLENNRYISDGNSKTIVIPKSKESLINENIKDKKIIRY